MMYIKNEFCNHFPDFGRDGYRKQQIWSTPGASEEKWRSFSRKWEKRADRIALRHGLHSEWATRMHLYFVGLYPRESVMDALLSSLDNLKTIAVMDDIDTLVGTLPKIII